MTYIYTHTHILHLITISAPGRTKIAAFKNKKYIFHQNPKCVHFKELFNPFMHRVQTYTQ